MFRRSIVFASLPLIVALIIVWSQAAQGTPSGDPAKLRALIIGVSNYKRLPRSMHLPRASLDATGFQQLLIETLKVPKGNIRVLAGEPTQDQVRAAWDDHLSKLKPGDVSVLFFSGHGQEQGKEPHLLLSDFDQDRGNGSVSLLNLVSMLKAKSNKALGIFIVDACRTDSGLSATANAASGKNGATNTPLESSDSFAPVRAPEGTFILYAASSNQVALHDLGAGDTSDYSVYSRVLFAALDKADRSLHEIAKDVRWKTYELALQRNGSDGRIKPHIQVPAYFDDLLRRRSLLGAELPMTELAIPGTATPRPLASIVGKGLEWPCPNCPEMVEIQPPDELTEIRGGQTTGGEKMQPIRLTNRYAIGKYEVTIDEWRACQIEGKCRIIDPQIRDGDRRPIAGVSWEDAQGFIAWLNSKPGLGDFRLPTEAEWEHAARGGTNSEFGPARDVAQLCDYGNGADSSLKSLLWANMSCNDGKAREVASAGSYRANKFGVHDMLGNVWEWVSDCADTASPCRQRVAKGGSWRSGPDSMKISRFRTLASDDTRNTVGFRVAREIK